MNAKLKLAIAVGIAIVIIVPVSILAYNAYVSSQENPLNFIPSNSTMVLKINYNNSTYYAFGGKSGIGLLIPISKGFGVGNSNLTFNNTTIPIVKYGTIGGFQVYKISAYDTIYNFITNRTSNISFPTSFNFNFSGNLNSYFPSIFNFSLYLFQPYSNYIFLGSLDELNYSIAANNQGSNFSHIKSYLSGNGMIDFYFNEYNITAWGNVSSSSVYIYISGNSTFISNLYNYSGYLHENGLKIIKVNSKTIEFIVSTRSS